LVVRVLKKPIYITCILIETSIKEYLKNYNSELILNLICMEKPEKIELTNFKTYVENHPDFLPPPPNSPNANIWVKKDTFEIPGTNTPTGTKQQIKVKLAESKGWDETKTVWEQVCKFGLCTDLPVAYRRTCSKRFYLVLEHPSLNSVKKEIEDCIKSSAVVAISILVTTGNVPLATSTFKSSFVSCLKLKGVQIADEISIKISEQKNCGSWRHIS